MEIFFIETSIVASKGRRNSESFQKSAKTETPHEISIKTENRMQNHQCYSAVRTWKIRKKFF